MACGRPRAPHDSCYLNYPDAPRRVDSAWCRRGCSLGTLMVHSSAAKRAHCTRHGAPVPLDRGEDL